MANVLFKRGTQSDLTKYLYDYTGSDKTTAIEGCFYLTSDTNRLYIGKNFGGAIGVKAVPVNQGAIPVDTVNNLPIPDAAIPGQFYYVVGSNILCVAAEGGWVQINTNTDHFIVEKQTAATYDSTNHKSTVTEILYNSNSSRIENDLEYIGANGLDVSVTPKYVLANRYTGGVQYYTVDNGVYSTTNVPTEQNWPSPNRQYYIRRGYSLTFTPATYQLTASVDNDNLTLNLSDGTNSSNVTINHGTNIAFSEYNGTITLSSTDTYVDRAKAGSGNSPASGVAYNGNGDSTGVTTSTKGFYVQIHNTSGATAGTWIDPQIRVGGEAAFQQTVQFDNGVAALPIYTTTEIDNKIRMFNAMEYQGVVDATDFGGIRTSNEIKSGYVWMAQEDIVVNPNSNPQITAHAGDLIIAYGTEDGPTGSHPGFIPYASINWQVVTSGASFDTQPFVDTDNTLYPNGIAIGKTVAGGGRAILGALQIAVNGTGNNDGQYLGISQTVNGTTKLIRVTHSLTNATTTANTLHVDQNNNDIVHTPAQIGGLNNVSTFDIPVPVINYDAAGHITGITTYAYQVVDSHMEITQPTLTATSSASTTATITSQFKADNQNITSTMNMTSDTINFSANSGNLIMNIEWGTFN